MFRNKTATNDLIWDNRSLFWSSDSGRHGIEDDSNLCMCAEDVSTELWSFSDGHRNALKELSEKSITLDHCSDELKTILTNSLPYTQDYHSLSEALSSFSQMVAQTLVLEGYVDFEIGAGWNRNNRQSKLEAARLTYIPTRSLIHIGSLVFQAVPTNANFDELPSSIIKLDSKRIVRFKLPKKWRRPLAKIRKQLPPIKRSEDLWLNQMASGRSREDLKTVKRKYNMQTARITAPIGWSARSLFNDEMADFQMVARKFQWKKFCVDLQNEILGTTNEAFQRIGQLCNETPELVWQHLPTMEQIDDKWQLIINGKAAFNTVLEF